MKKEEFIKLGLDEETATKCETASMDELKKFIPKSRFDEVNEENKVLKSNLTERDAQLETLKNSAKDNENLKVEIEKLQGENQRQLEEYQAKIDEMKVNSAIENALLGAKAKNITAVKALLDTKTVKIEKDGSVTGIAEQVEKLIADDNTKFLFDISSSNQGFQGLNPMNSNNQNVDINAYETRLMNARNQNNQLEAIKIKQEAAAEGITLL